MDVIVVDDGEGDAILLSETADRPLQEGQWMRWRVAGGELRIEYGSWPGCIGAWRKHLEVRVPRAYATVFEHVVIEGSSGSYRVRGLGCGAMKLKLASGRIDADRVMARELVIDVTSGRASASGRFDERVDVNVASGKAWVLCEDSCPRAIAAGIASGGVHVALPASSGFTARVTKASGRFSSGFPLVQEGRCYRCGDGSACVDVRMASGSFALDSVGSMP